MDTSQIDCAKCNVCDETFSLKNLKSHMVMHIKAKFTCTQCNKSFRSQGGFDYHVIAHSGVKSCICSRCGKAFILAGQLKLHIKTVHDLVSPTKTYMMCTQCDKSFSSQGALDYHMMAHSGKKPFTCSQCDKAFILASQLKRHIQTVHELETPYKCNECKQEFSQSGNLKAHIKRWHSEQRLFKCEKCYRSFNLANRLIRHICKICLSEAEEGEIHNTMEEGELCH